MKATSKHIKVPSPSVSYIEENTFGKSHPHPASFGSSPPSSSSPKFGNSASKNYAEAKAFFAKIKYSDAFDTSLFEVGYVVDQTSDRRRSGVEAWSQRVHSVVVDIPFDEFAKEEGKAFHRVKYFKKDGVVVWEATSRKFSPASSLSSSPQLNEYFRNLNVTFEDAALSTSLYTEDVLPNEAWRLILEQLNMKEVCTMASVSKHLNQMVMESEEMWMNLYKKTFGSLPEPKWSSKVVRHILSRSERAVCRWLSSEPSVSCVGHPSTQALDMDDSHVVSGDGNHVRVWIHKTDRRIKTLQGHSANVSCIGFDNNYISSGDITGHLKLWSMDELKNIKSMRAHADSVSDTLHFNALCVTSSLDGFIKVWDATQAHPLVLSLDAGSKIYKLCIHGAQNRLYSVGMDIEGWDLETSQNCLQIQEEDSLIVDPVAYYGYPVDVWPGTGNSTKAIANNGNLLASAGKGHVNLYDIRSTRRCCTWQMADTEGREVSITDPSAYACTGLHMDDWKLVCGFQSKDSCIRVYDIRAASNQAMNTKPVIELSEQGKRIMCFKVYDSYVLAGIQGEECCLWNFDQSIAIKGNSDSDTDEKPRQRRRSSKKCPKQRKRYPKRTTR